MSQIINATQGHEPNATKMTAKGGKQLPVDKEAQVSQTASEDIKADSKRPVEPVEQPAVENAVVELNEHFQSVNRDLHFSVDEESGESIIKVVNRDTEEVVRQIPAEYVLKLAQNLNDNKELTLFSTKV
ncbi:MAG: flagellar biosynthesis protein FlaG [Kangiellaceae bacterium]|jgi:flagellar protein FlaG|nr:flagellar biosynthesis protein FlaG [Kangiellaceae bacterium]|tara:strand:+ start:4128 stop:4514 length:387 start_codon:yes stop_codon:yes gene_type:complete